jgi:hypothetical protein
MGNCERREIVFVDTPPKWFEAVPGFRFRDPDGDIVMVVGQGGWREAVAMPGGNYDLKFHPWTLVGMFNYKGEWHPCDLTLHSAEYWAKCTPIGPIIS